MRIDTTTQAGPSALFGGETAAEGDFLALLAALVGGGGADAEAGVLLPSSPLLEADGDLPDDLLETVTATGDDEADEAGAPGPWLVSPALAALLARPAVLSDTSPLTVTATGADGDDATQAALEVGVDTDLPQAGLPDADAPSSDGAPGAGGPATGAQPATTDADHQDVATRAAADPRTATAAADEQTAPGQPATTASTTTMSGAIDTDGAGDDVDAAREPDAGPRRAVGVRTDPSAEPRSTTRVDAAFDVGDALQTDEATGPAGAGRERAAAPAMSSAISRVLDALERLERMPPPRQVVLELGEVRVRLGLEDGAVRMQVLGEDRGQGRDLLRAAEEALRERGFDLAGERGEGGRERPADQQRPDLAPPRPGNGAARGGRPADRPTGAGARTAIHL